MTDLTKLEEDILIAEYDGVWFKPCNGKKSIDTKLFQKYEDCLELIRLREEFNISPAKGWAPAIGPNRGLGDYRTDFSDLMRVVNKILLANKWVGGPFGFRTFGILPDGTYAVRYDNCKVFTADNLIDALFEATIDVLKGLKP